MKKSKIKRYIRNGIFMILMTISGYILLPFLSVLFIASLLYVPIELIIYHNSEYKNIKGYSYLYTLYYRKTVKILKYYNINSIEYKYDSDNKFFIFFNDNINYILFINSKNKRERTRIISSPMDKYLSEKYSIVDYKYINKLNER